MKHKFAWFILSFWMVSSGFAVSLMADNSDILLVLDNSGSMRKNDPQHLMHDVVTRFARQLTSGSRLGIVIFGKEATLVLPLTSINQVEFPSQLEESLRKVDYSSAQTDTPAGVERAIYELRQNSLPDVKRIVILFTDGIVDVGNAEKGLERERWLRSNLTLTARQLGVRIFAIAFTEEADFQLMQSVAQGTEGEYFRILRDHDIEGVFRQLSAKLFPIPSKQNSIKAPLNSTPIPTRGSRAFAIIIAGITATLILFWAVRRRRNSSSSAPLAKPSPTREDKPSPVRAETSVTLKTAEPPIQETLPKSITPAPGPAFRRSEIPLAAKVPPPIFPQPSIMCSKHPLWKATETCPECLQKKCKNCMTERNGRALCADCAKKLNNR
jgi:uncharacterized protein YegL